MKKFGTPIFAGPGRRERVARVRRGGRAVRVRQARGAHRGGGVLAIDSSVLALTHPEAEVEVEALLGRLALAGLTVLRRRAVGVGLVRFLRGRLGRRGRRGRRGGRGRRSAAGSVAVGAGRRAVVSHGRRRTGSRWPRASRSRSRSGSAWPAAPPRAPAWAPRSEPAWGLAGVAAAAVSTAAGEDDAVAVGVGSSAFAGMPSRAATATALTRAVERIRRVTSPSVSAPSRGRLEPWE